MKRFTLTLLITLIGAVSIFAQAPHAFNYQAIIRDSLGNIITNQIVSFRIGVIQDSINGILVYSETHSSITNQFGLVVLEIGNGTVETGVFENINWGATSHFLKLELDETGGTNYQFMGTSELLSVPYSINSGSLTLTSPNGIIFKVTIDDNGNLLTNCNTMPPMSNAGPDQDSICIPASLEANDPQYCNGVWSIVNGTGGSFADATNPVSEFTGIAGNAYVLRWTITNICGYTEDDVNISFEAPPDIADAGTNQTDACSPTNLAANTPGNGTGLWTIISGTGGNITDPSDPVSTFTGLIDSSYTLRWSIITTCDTSYDEVNINFDALPTVADAGTDQIDVYNPTTLTANSPDNGTGLWTILSGTGGNITDPSDSASYFSGIVDSSYTLRWTISTACDSTYDEVNISFTQQAFTCGNPFIDARDGQIYSTVQIGSWCWMAENLNIGTMISGYQNMSNNSTIEKYCYADDTSNCDTYGGLYQWNEMMQYVTTPGAQGICPTGWHIPNNYEWCMTEQVIDPTVGCGYTGWMGNDVGGKMKEAGITHWNPPNTGATNSSGFTALPGGFRADPGMWVMRNSYGFLWCSEQNSSSTAHHHSLAYDMQAVYKYPKPKYYGYSVRCIRN